MTSANPWRFWGLVSVAAWMAFSSAICRADDRADRAMQLDTRKLVAPEKWTRVTPKSSIVSYEFSIAPSEGDKQPGRMTVMAAGGGVQANIDRWIGQFTQPDGGSTKDLAKIETKRIAGTEVHLVDLSGTFADRPSPMAPAVEREHYRMLGAIIVTGKAQFFIKFYGPERTVSDHKDGFEKMIDGLAAR